MVLGDGSAAKFVRRGWATPLPLDISYYLYSIIHLDRYSLLLHISRPIFTEFLTLANKVLDTRVLIA